MPFSERVEELERAIRSAVTRAVADLREELTDRLQRTHDELLHRVEELEPQLPDDLINLSELAPLAAQEAATARRSIFTELRDALAAIDRGRSQAEVLAALLAESSRYGSRALLLLIRDGELRAWGGRGFGDDEAVRGLTLPLAAGNAWTTLAAGHGTVPLSAHDCAALCSRLESELPRGGVAVPLVLRDRIVAALYADRLGGDELLVEGLQALVYAAAQAIESLAFRERDTTATLQLAAVEAVVEAPAGETWSPPAAAPSPRAEEPTAAWPVRGELFAEEAEEEPAAATAAAAEPYVEEPAPEPAVEEPAAAAPAEPEPYVPEPYGAAIHEAPLFEEPARAVEPPESAPAPAAGIEQEGLPAPVWGEPLEDEEMVASLDDTAAMYGSPLEDIGAGGWRLEDSEAGAAASGAAVAEPEAEAWGAPVEEPAVPPPPSWRSAPTAEWRAAEEVEPEVEAEPAPPEPTTARITGLQPSETVLLRSPFADPAPLPFTPAPTPPPPPAPTPSPAPSTDVEPAAPAQTMRISAIGAEVQPPTGVQGPGWAFATTRVQVSADEEAQHEEARRLARLLVSEIKLYNEEQVDEGRRNRDLYERLKEDIDRSRQMYEERVEQRILNTTDYFYQELVRILAAGDSRALGI